MTLDPRFFFMAARQPKTNLAGAFNQGMQAGQNFKNMRQDQAVRDAYKNNMQDDGSMDRKGLMRDLYNASPDAAMKMQDRFASQDAATQKAQMEKQTFDSDMISRVAPLMKDETSYQKGLAYLQKRGVDVGQAPERFDPNFVDFAYKSALSAKDQLSQSNADRDFAFKQSEADRDYGMDQNRLAFDQNKFNQQMAFDKYKMKNKPTEVSAFDKQRYKKQADKYMEGQEGLKRVDDSLAAVDDALNAQQNFSQDSLFGTGPVAQYLGANPTFNREAEALNAKLRSVDLKNMVSTFAGMSKAIDSDAERAAWQGTQANIGNDDRTNMKILLGQKSILLKDKAEAQAQRQWVEQNGSLDNYQSPVDGRIQSVVNASGEMILIPKAQVEQAKKQGFMDVDEYAARAVSLGGVGLKEKRQRGQSMQEMAIQELKRRREAQAQNGGQ